MKTLVNLTLAGALLITACSAPTNKEENTESVAEESAAINLVYPNEKHFKNVRQLTFGGDNAEAYWNSDNTKLVMQSSFTGWGLECDQIFYFDVKNDNLKENKPTLLSTGKGRTTCSYFLPGDTTIVYGSTHLGGDACPPVPERRADGKYLWPVYSTFDIFVADLEGNIINQLTDEPGYAAEATAAPKV